MLVVVLYIFGLSIFFIFCLLNSCVDILFFSIFFFGIKVISVLNIIVMSLFFFFLLEYSLRSEIIKLSRVDIFNF